MWMPKIAAKYSPDDHRALRTNYSMGYWAPSIKELFFNWDHMGMLQIRGNSQLKPEKNHYFALGTEEGEQYHRTDWDLTFCGHRLRTNSGTSGIGKGGAADLGYGEYDKWMTSCARPMARVISSCK